jgi:hypothetical protein
MSNTKVPHALSAASSTRQSASRQHFIGTLARAAVVLLVSCAYVAEVFRIHEPSFWSAGLGDWMDPYFINALLEHWYRAAGNLSDPSSPPMFFPATKTLGHSHGLVLYAPFYMLPRLVLHPFVAGNVALALMMETGIICLYVLLRRLKLSFVEALLLAAFFFSSQNVINGATGTWAQRLSVFLIPPILLLLVEAMERRTGAIAVTLACVSGLFATLLYAQDVYTAHFASLLVACAMIAVLVIDGGLKRAMQTFWRTQSAAMLVALVIAIGAGAWATAIARFGGVELYVFGLKIASHAWRRPAWVALIASLAWLWMNRRMIRAHAHAPRPSPWFAGFAAGAVAGAAIVAWMYLGAFLQHRSFPEEHLLNALRPVGPLSWSHPREAVEALRGYYTLRPFVLVVALTCLAWLPWFGVDRRLRRYWLWLLAVSALAFLIPLRFGDTSVWRMLIEPLPGFGVIRDPQRIIYVYELALVVVITLLLAPLPGRAAYRWVTTGLVVLLMATAWNRESFGYSRPVETFQRWVAAPIAVDRACRSFYIKGASDTYMARSDHKWTLYNVDAMFVAFALGLPTLNGYSAFAPEGWDLANPQEPNYAEHVTRWIGQHHLTGVCELDIETRVMRPVQ